MFSPKVIAGVVIVVAIIALLLINFEGIADRAKGLLKNGQKSGSGEPTISGRAGHLDLTVYPQGVFVLRPDSSLNISLETTVFSDFLGEIRIDYVNKTIRFTDSRTPLKVDFPLNKVNLRNLRLTKLDLQNTKMDIKKDGWSKSLENGTVDVDVFIGSGAISSESVQFIGNVSSFEEK